jgi:hypothetical protein
MEALRWGSSYTLPVPRGICFRAFPLTLFAPALAGLPHQSVSDDICCGYPQQIDAFPGCLVRLLRVLLLFTLNS